MVHKAGWSSLLEVGWSFLLRFVFRIQKLVANKRLCSVSFISICFCSSGSRSAGAPKRVHEATEGNDDHAVVYVRG